MDAKIAEPREKFEADKIRLEQEIERFRKGVAIQYNTDIEISSIERNGGVKMKMFFSEVELIVNGEIGPGALADFIDYINNGFEYRGDPGYSTYDPLGEIGFAEGVKQHIGDMNLRIKGERI